MAHRNLFLYYTRPDSILARKSEEFKLMRKFSLFRFCIKLFASKNCYTIQSTQKHRKDGHILQDKEIIRRIQQGNKELLRDVIEKYYDEILRFCIYQIKDPAYACDLTQETFYRFIRCVDTYQYKNLKKYLIAIARNLCVDYWHGNLPTEPLPEDDSLQNTEMQICRKGVKCMTKLLQSLCFLLLLLLFWSLGRTENKEFLYIPMTASAPVFSMLMIAGCRREETYNIAELTGSCFFNYRQLCVLRMILYGMVNLSFMTVLSFFLCAGIQRSVLEAGIYFLVPFLMTGCVQFAILLTGTGRRNHYSLIAGCLFMTAGWTGAASFPEIYEPAALTVWMILLFLCMISYGIETAAILRQIERGDLLCTN